MAASITSEIMLAGPYKLPAAEQAAPGPLQCLTEKERPRKRTRSFLFPRPEVFALVQYFHEAAGAVDPDMLAILDYTGSAVDAYDRRDAVFAGDDGSVGHQAAHFGD